MSLVLSDYFHKIDPRVWAVTVSLIISFVLGCNFYINPDGILYLNTANSFLMQQTSIPPVGAKWPFYPLLIAGLGSLTGLTTQTNALLLQALFLALFIVSFINIVRTLGGNRVIQHLAAIVILLHPDLNDNRNMIIRDFGYWAFLFTSFFYLLRYIDKPSWLNALVWIITIGIATLFRIEGIVIAVLAPLLIFFLPNTNYGSRLLHVLRFYSLWLIAGFIAISVIVWHTQSLTLDAFGRIAELPLWWERITGSFLRHWGHVRETLSPLFPEMKNPHINIFLTGGLLIYAIYRLINTLGVTFFAVSFYGQIKNCLKEYASSAKYKMLYGFLAINVFIIVVFSINYWFLASRYLMTISIILLIWVPFTLFFIYQQWQKTSYHQRFPWLGKSLAIILTLVLFVDCYISFGPSHKFVLQSADWIQSNIPAQSTLYSNNASLAYYAERPGTDWYADPVIIPLDKVLKKRLLKNYDYAAFYINRNDKKYLKKIPALFGYPPLAKFNNKHGDLILIYKVTLS